MAALPVREMVLYKHGVGFFVREGEFTAQEIALNFRQDEINDVLKSLTVFDRAGGQVLGIHYQTPMDKAARLASTSIRLSPTQSLQDLLRDLRGRQVALTMESTPGSLETVAGRVIGIDQVSGSNSPFAAATKATPNSYTPFLSLLAEDNQVHVFRLDDVRTIQIQDSQSSHDLSYFLDTSMSEDDRRTVTLRLSEGDHRLVVSYVAPSPTWRVSYRIVAESEEGQDSGKALLQGWGLFDNRLDEDLENVRVTLVAGQPISFIYDLYASRIPQRPTVQDEARIAPGPVEFQGGIQDITTASPSDKRRLDGGERMLMESESAPSTGGRSLLRRIEAGKTGASLTPANYESLKQRLLSEFSPRMLPPSASEMRSELAANLDTALLEGNYALRWAEKQQLFERLAAEIFDQPRIDLGTAAQSAQSAAQGKESGEFFQYRVTAPVSVKRGGSALVPILGTEVPYDRELLYNGAKLPEHPVVALRFANTTGLTLERGPVTVVENRDYRGEAMIAFTKDGNEIYIPYAVELGVRVTERPHSRRERSGLHISQGYLRIEEYQIQQVSYIIENTTAHPLTVTLEAPIQTDWELVDTRTPDVENVTERRWRVDVLEYSKAEFVRKERHLTERYEGLRDLKFEALQRFLKDRWLDQSTFDRLADMLNQIDSTKQLEQLKGKLNTERDTLYKQQEQLRANLSALQSTGQEAALRKRMLDQLEATQNRLEEIEREIKQAELDIAAAEARVQEIIAALG